MNARHENGTSTVEFAVVAAVLFMMIFGVMEIGRGYYVYAMLDEVSRRGSRLAAVCPVNDPAISQMAVFNASGDTSGSNLVNGLTPGHVVIDYLDAANGVVALPTDPAGFMQIRYVRARVVNFQHTIAVPFVAGMNSIQMPEFESILPRESLGVPRDGAITPC
jgi:Flp pilus assembly protein TadG